MHLCVVRWGVKYVQLGSPASCMLAFSNDKSVPYEYLNILLHMSESILMLCLLLKCTVMTGDNMHVIMQYQRLLININYKVCY